MASKVAATRARKPKENNGAASLLAALKFVNLAQHKEGATNQTHCMIKNGRIVAFDGVIAAGHLIEEDLCACPHTGRLLDSLAKCGQTLSITQLDSGRLSIKSDKFKAFVPCVPFDELPEIEPDAPCALIDDRLKAGFEAVAPLVAESAPRAMLAAALLQSGSVVSTNGHMLVEYWHGIDLPNNLLIPKAALTAILKSGKKLAKFGFSPNSATFFFDDESFIKTQLFSEPYPAYETILNHACNPWPLPPGFYDALRKLKSLSENNTVYFQKAGLSVRDSQANQSGGYEMDGLKEGLAFNIEYLIMVEALFKQVDFETQEGKAFFFGQNARGAIMGIRG